MKSYQQINPGVTLTHKGDITIEGDIGEGAELHVINGLVNIKGNVAQNAKIILTVSEEQLSNTSNSGLSSLTQFGAFTSGAKMRIGKTISSSDDVSSSPPQVIITGSVMDNVTINARDDINISGECPENARLHSSNGEVNKARKPSRRY